MQYLQTTTAALFFQPLVSNHSPAGVLIQSRTATKKAGGSTKNNRDSNPKYLGVKKGDGQTVKPGDILIRQRGFKYRPGLWVGSGRDHTLYSLAPGIVRYFWDSDQKQTRVSVVATHPVTLKRPEYWTDFIEATKQSFETGHEKFAARQQKESKKEQQLEPQLSNTQIEVIH